MRFREFGLDHVADDEPASIEVLARYAAGRRAWVADVDGSAVGYILVDEIDGAAHIEQVSVMPHQQGRGLGRALVEQAARWAASQDLSTLTLTTFGHIPWNRPLYEHLGFRVLAEDEIGPGLRAIREAEAAHGLDPTVRVVMRRDLGYTPTGTGTGTGRSQVLVRRAQREEIGATADVYLRSRHAAVPAIPPLIHNDETVRAWFTDTVFPRRDLWIAEHPGDGIVGLLVLHGDLVDQLYVDPRHTGAGIGSELLTVAQSLRPGGLQLWTFQCNMDARRFYERHGFIAVAETDGAGNEEQAPDVRYCWKPA